MYGGDSQGREPRWLGRFRELEVRGRQRSRWMGERSRQFVIEEDQEADFLEEMLYWDISRRSVAGRR